MANDNVLFGVGSNFSGSTIPSIGGGLTSDFLSRTTGLDNLLSVNNNFTDIGSNNNNFGFGQNLGIGSNLGGANTVNGFQPIPELPQTLPQQSLQQPLQQGGFINGLQNFSKNFLNKDFLIGSKDNLGLLTGGAAIAQTIGGIRNSNRQFNLGKRQYNDQIKIFNNNQQNLKENSIREAKGILDSSSFSKDFTDAERQAYIDQRTYKPKSI